MSDSRWTDVWASVTEGVAMEEFEWSCPTCGFVLKHYKLDIHAINRINAHQLSHGDI